MINHDVFQKWQLKNASICLRHDLDRLGRVSLVLLRPDDVARLIVSASDRKAAVHRDQNRIGLGPPRAIFPQLDRLPHRSVIKILVWLLTNRFAFLAVETSFSLHLGRLLVLVVDFAVVL